MLWLMNWHAENCIADSGKPLSTSAACSVFVYRISVLIGFAYAADDMTGHTCGHYTFRDVSVDYTAGADDRIGADRNTGQDGDICPDPDVISDMDGQGDLQAFDPLGCIKGMPGGCDDTVGGYEDIVADSDMGAVEDGQVMIAVEVGAKGDIGSIVTIEGLGDDHVLTVRDDLFQ